MDDELYHYGVKGMKWGVRRTPAQLGHLVSTGAKKVGGKVSEISAKRKKKKQEEEETRPKTTKDIKKMSTAELQQYYNRLNLQRNILTTQQEISRLQPKKVSAGEKFINALKGTAKRTLVPAAESAGKQYIEKMLKESLGLNEKNSDSLKTLRDEVERLNLTNKKGLYEDQINKRNREREEAKKTSTESKKSNDSGSSSTQKQTSSQSSQTSQSSSKSNDHRDYVPNWTYYKDPDTIQVTDFTVETVNTGRDYSRNYLDTPVAGLLPPSSTELRRR